MKCSSCNSEWPANVKFCGKCGAKMTKPAAPNPALGSPKATEVDNLLKSFLPKLRLGRHIEIKPGIHLIQKGSTHVEVRVIPMGPLIAVKCTAPVTIGTPITQALLRFLLDENAKILFGAFGIGLRKEIIFTHTIMATSMDMHELGSSVSSVLNMADKYDDQIVQRWGGKTSRQTAMDQILAPALLKALLQAKKGNINLRPGGMRGIKPQHQRSPHVKPAVKVTAQQPAATVIAGIGGAMNQNSSTTDVSKAIKVSSIPEEYAYLARQRCSCGGRYDRNAQGLLRIKGLMYDQLSVSCSECGNERQFLFDINSFYGK